MNYLKFKATRLAQKLEGARPAKRLASTIQRLLVEAVSIRNQIVRSNLRLVVSVAKRHTLPGTDFFEVVSDGNVSLMRAADSFDYTRGIKFATYATWAIAPSSG